MEESYGRGFTEGELRTAQWWVAHQITIRKWFRIFLYIGNALLWGYVAWGLLDAYALSYPRESRLTQVVAENQQVLDRLWQDRPVNIGTGQVFVFKGTEDRVDLAVEMENPNADWWVEFVYSFRIAGTDTTPRQGFILPSSRVTLTELGVIPDTPGGQRAQLVIDHVRWHRVNPDAVAGDYSRFFQDRFGGVSAQNIRLDRQALEVGERQVPVTIFELQNNGPYGYWSVDVVVKLFRGNTFIGVNRVSLRSVKPGERRTVRLSWFEDLSGVTRTEVLPIVNILDPSVYLPASAFSS